MVVAAALDPVRDATLSMGLMNQHDCAKPGPGSSIIDTRNNAVNPYVRLPPIPGNDAWA